MGGATEAATAALVVKYNVFAPEAKITARKLNITSVFISMHISGYAGSLYYSPMFVWSI